MKARIEKFKVKIELTSDEYDVMLIKLKDSNMNLDIFLDRLSEIDPSVEDVEIDTSSSSPFITVELLYNDNINVLRLIVKLIEKYIEDYI